MTNEDRLEGRLFDAYDRGYYDDVMELIRKYRIQYPKKTHYDLYDMALPNPNWYKQDPENK